MEINNQYFLKKYIFFAYEKSGPRMEKVLDTGAQISTKQQGDFGNNIRDYLRLPAC